MQTCLSLVRAESTGTPALMLAVGDLVPGHGVVDSLDGSPAAIGAEDVALAVTVGAPAITAFVVASALAAPSVRLSTGDASPLGGTFRTLGTTLSSGGDGRVVFAGTLTAATALSGIFSNFGAGATETVAMTGQAAPGGGSDRERGFSPAAD